MEDAILQIILQARDEASATIKNLTNSLGDAQRGASIVSGAMLVTGAAIAGVSIYSTKLASDFQSAMTMVQTGAGASAQEVKTMSASVLSLAGQVGQTPIDLANALYFVESAGYRGSQALDILRISAEGAAVGHANLTQTANVLTSVLASGIGGVHSISDAMGVLNATVGGGKMKLQDLVDAMSTGILPAAKAAGISMQQLGATLDVFTNNGVPAVDAASRLRMSIGLMATPSSTAIKSLKEMGMQSTQLANDMQSGGIVKALQDLHEHLKNLSKVQQENVIGKMFGTRKGASMMTLLDNVTQLKDRLDNVNKTAGNFGSAWQTTSSNAAMASQKLWASVQTLGVEYGNILLPIVTKFANFLADNLIPFIEKTTQFFEKHRLAVVLLAGVVGGILTASIIAFTIAMAPAVIAVGAFIIAFLPFILLGAAIVAAVALVIVYWKQLQEVGKTVFSALGTFFTNLGNTIHGIVGAIIQDVKNMVNSIIDHIDGLIKGVNSVSSKVHLPAIPEIPHFAGGTNNAPGGLSLVGENGPELVNLPRGSQVIPNSQINNYSNRNANVTLGPVYVSNEMDVDTMVRRLSMRMKFNSAI